MSIACNDQKSGFARWEVPESWESASLSEQVLEDRSQQMHVNIRLWPHHQSEIVPSDKRVCRTRTDLPVAVFAAPLRVALAEVGNGPSRVEAPCRD